MCVRVNKTIGYSATFAKRSILLIWLLLVFQAQAVPQTAELVVQIGHSDFINSVAFSGDGKLIATGSDDTTIKLWDVASGLEIRTLVGHASRIRMVAFSPTTNLLASASDGDQIKLWDVLTGEELWSTTDGGQSIAFSPDGKLLAGGVGGKIRFWSAATHKLIQTLEHGPHASVSSLAFSPNGRLLASGSYDGTIKIWVAGTGKEKCSMAVKGHSTMLKQVVFEPKGRSLFSISWDGIVREWDFNQCKELRQFAKHKVHINWLAFNPTGKIIATASAPLPDSPSEMAAGVDQTIGLWDVRTGEGGTPLERDDGEIKTVSFSPDGKFLAGAGSKRSMTLWDAATGKISRNIEPHSAAVGSVVSVMATFRGCSGNARRRGSRAQVRG